MKYSLLGLVSRSLALGLGSLGVCKVDSGLLQGRFRVGQVHS